MSPALHALDLPRVGPTPFQLGDLRGKVVLVSFFATWCFPCLADLPVLEKLQKDYAAKGFTVVAVGLDLEGAKMLGPWAEQYALPFPVLVGDDALRGAETPFGRISALPTIFLFGRDGQVVFAYQGVASPERLIDQVGQAVRR
jgi:thiol-disulfide isomerase/thioredoxin